jgi:hypothetical protein
MDGEPLLFHIGDLSAEKKQGFRNGGDVDENQGSYLVENSNS